jgi:uncharacterized membrane protein YcaP (DUF421 family)
MDTIIRGVVLYLFLLIIFRFNGKRALVEATVFDFVLLLIIAETTDQSLLGDDKSLTGTMLLIVTLIGMDIVMSLLKQKFRLFEKVVDGGPVILLDNGKLLHERMKKERVDESDILESARELKGLMRLDQIKYAILERDGTISVIPKEEAS